MKGGKGFRVSRWRANGGERGNGDKKTTFDLPYMTRSGNGVLIRMRREEEAEVEEEGESRRGERKRKPRKRKNEKAEEEIRKVTE